MLADIRGCEECGAPFVPRREHARFCSARCRAAWNRERMGELPAEESTLLWCLTAMADASERLGRARAPDQAQAPDYAWGPDHSPATAVIAEAVWWITIVDARLVRHHPEAYDATLARWAAAERRLVEETLAGLRFVRNRIGEATDLAELVQPAESRAADGHIIGWTWRSIREPALDWLSPRGKAWELTRYRAYQAQLAGHAIGQSFGRTAAFLKLAARRADGIGVPTADDVSAELGQAVE